VAHCKEALEALPPELSRMVVGDTDDPSRNEALSLARERKIKYLVSVNCLLTGVNIPAINCLVWLRPTSSLLLFIQGIGRGLRLHPDKKECLVLDYSGNCERFSDIDDPIINEALQPTKETEHEYIIPCLSCAERGVVSLNSIHCRRCRAVIDGKRCEHYFEWKDCEHCNLPNDKCSRACRGCGAELIDPNAKLTSKATKLELVSFDIIKGNYWLTEPYGKPMWNCMYQTKQGLNIYESFNIKDARMKNIFYGIWIRTHVIDSSKYYPVLESIPHLRKLLESGDIKTPHTLECIYENNRYRIKRRHFIGVPELSSHA
jgi:DNA repair protein RadD